MSKAIVFDRFGSPDVLYVKEVQNRSLNNKEILIKNSFAAVNPIDYKIRNGSSFVCKKRSGIAFHWTLGFDVAGTVVKAGADSVFKIGDKVVAKSGDVDDPHGYQEELIVRDDQAVRVPDGVDLAEAAGIVTVGVTALSIIDRLPAETQSVLVSGASGGVGHVLVQILKTRNYTVGGMCSAANLSFVKELGADSVYDYKELQDSSELCFDAVVDMQGGKTGINLYRFVKDNGTLITVPTITADEVVREAPVQRGVSAAGVLALFTADRLSLLLSLIKEQKVRVHISNLYSPEEADLAHKKMEDGHTKGKILIKF